MMSSIIEIFYRNAEIKQENVYEQFRKQMKTEWKKKESRVHPNNPRVVKLTALHQMC
jgi:hypothetical protein